jgi:hypothetical protein
LAVWIVEWTFFLIKQTISETMQFASNQPPASCLAPAHMQQRELHPPVAYRPVVTPVSKEPKAPQTRRHNPRRIPRFKKEPVLNFSVTESKRGIAQKPPGAAMHQDSKHGSEAVPDPAPNYAECEQERNRDKLNNDRYGNPIGAAEWTSPLSLGSEDSKEDSKEDPQPKPEPNLLARTMEYRPTLRLVPGGAPRSSRRRAG